MTACAIPECPHPHYAKGWCTAHYQRAKRYGDPLGAGDYGMRRTNYPTPESATCAWAAGFIDGEGTLTLSSTGKARPGWHRVIVTAANVDREPLERLMTAWGGNLRVRKRPHPRARIPHEWMIGGRRAGWFLEDIDTYLCERSRAKARVIQRYLAIRARGDRSDHAHAELEVCVTEIRALNVRGEGTT